MTQQEPCAGQWLKGECPDHTYWPWNSLTATATVAAVPALRLSVKSFHTSEASGAPHKRPGRRRCLWAGGLYSQWGGPTAGEVQVTAAALYLLWEENILCALQLWAGVDAPTPAVWRHWFWLSPQLKHTAFWRRGVRDRLSHRPLPLWIHFTHDWVQTSFFNSEFSSSLLNDLCFTKQQQQQKTTYSEKNDNLLINSLAFDFY